jgi:hypothetical protein
MDGTRIAQLATVQFPAGSRTFYFPDIVQTVSEAHTVCHPIGCGGFFSGSKGGLGMKLTTHLRLLPELRMFGAMPSLQHISPCRRA